MRSPQLPNSPSRSGLPHRYQMTAFSVLLALVLNALPYSFLAPPAQAQSLSERIQSLFTRRRQEGNASGRRRGGGIRDQCNVTQSSNKPLMALIPENNLGLTTVAYPTFWFYLPFGRSATDLSVQFMLLDEDGFPVLKNNQPISVTLPETASVVGFQLPETEQPLVVNQQYSWHLTLVCNASFGSMDLTEVSGSIQRVEPSATLSQELEAASPQDHYVAYANAGIWYDALTQLAHHRTTFSDDWAQLLSLFELQDLADMPISELRSESP